MNKQIEPTRVHKMTKRKKDLHEKLYGGNLYNHPLVIKEAPFRDEPLRTTERLQHLLKGVIIRKSGWQRLPFS